MCDQRPSFSLTCRFFLRVWWVSEWVGVSWIYLYLTTREDRILSKSQQNEAEQLITMWGGRDPSRESEHKMKRLPPIGGVGNRSC